MGFHICEYCTSSPKTSSGDVTMSFSSGRTYVAPDMLTHYVRDHEYTPPRYFVDDVMNSELIAGDRRQTRGVPTATEPIGYLSGEFPKGTVPAHFVEKLQRVMELAAQFGARVQTKSIVLNKPSGTRHGLDYDIV